MNVVVGKNYRLQNIQLSKITVGGLRPQARFATSARGDPNAPLAPPFATLPSLDEQSSVSKHRRTRQRVNRALSTRRAARFQGPQPRPATRSIALAVNLVENTGLEPVTSWLQTRRSPS